MRHHAFWALFSTFFFTAVGMFAIAPQIVAYLIEIGFAPLQAATAWGFSGVVLVFGMLGVSALDGLIDCGFERLRQPIPWVRALYSRGLLELQAGHELALHGAAIDFIKCDAAGRPCCLANHWC